MISAIGDTRLARKGADLMRPVGIAETIEFSRAATLAIEYGRHRRIRCKPRGGNFPLTAFDV